MVLSQVCMQGRDTVMIFAQVVSSVLLRQDENMGNLQELNREGILIFIKASHHPRSQNSITINAFTIKTTDRISIPFIHKYVKTAIHSSPRDIT